MSSHPISSMLLIIGICFAFASISLATKDGQSSAGGCLKVPKVKDACPDEE
jgi:hypothetical protein